MTATVLMVGARDGALAAAEQRGLRVYLLSERRPSRARAKRLAGLWVVDPTLPVETVWLGLSQRFPELLTPEGRPDAVIGTTEGSVELAAALRARLRVSGVDGRTAHWCKDKLAMKRRARFLGIPCADFARVGVRTSATHLVQRLGLPLVLKPVGSSGSRGTVVAQTFNEVAKHLSPGTMAESFVHGLEMSVESLVRDGRVQFVNVTEYLLPLWANVVPATLLPQALEQVLALNEQVIRGFGVRQGMTHLELYLTPAGPVFGEVAARPPGGHVMELISRAYGFDAWQAWLATELGEAVELPQAPKNYSGVWFLHPGEGIVNRVSGVQVAAQYSGVEAVHCRVQAGDVLKPRAGSGESAGHVIASGASRQEVVNALQVARRSILIETRPVAQPEPHPIEQRGTRQLEQRDTRQLEQRDTRQLEQRDTRQLEQRRRPRRSRAA